MQFKLYNNISLWPDYLSSTENGKNEKIMNVQLVNRYTECLRKIPIKDLCCWSHWQHKRKQGND